MHHGDYYLSQGKLAMARQQYMAAAALNKTDAEPYLAMSRLEDSAGNLGAAADRLGTVLYYHPTYPHIQCRRAQLYGMANRYETAFTIAQDAVKIEPNCAAAHNDMGMLLEQSDDVQGAAGELGKAHTLAPDDEALTLDYARVLAKSGKPDDALNIVEAAEYGRGGKRDYIKAQTFLGSALSLNHNHTASLAESGKIFLRQHAYTAAQDQLEKAFKLGPDTLDMIYDLEALYTAQKSPKAAEALATKQQMNDMLVPLKTYRRRWIQHPDDLDNMVSLSRAEMGAGNMLDAFDLIKRVLQANPNREGAIELYNQMKSGTAPGTGSGTGTGTLSSATR
jgi:tetratricopeptide (TPR) repeat protein